MVERDRLLERLQPVAERRREVDQPANARRLGGPNDVGGASRVRGGVLGPVLRILVRRGSVRHDVWPERVPCPLDDASIDDGVLDEGQVVVCAEAVAPRRRKVVDHENLVAAGEQAVGKVRADEPGSAGDQHLHTGTSLVRRRSSPARSWNARCHSSSESRPQSLRPNRGSPSSCARTLRLSITSRPSAACDDRTSVTKSRTGPGCESQSCRGTGKPILSRRSRISCGRNDAKALLRTCFRCPSRNLTSAGIVAASSTSGWSSNGTRDSRPCAMLTRSSTWSSAGRSVLKSKCVIESKYASFCTLSPWKIERKVSKGEYVPRSSQLTSSPSVGARLMRRK